MNTLKQKLYNIWVKFLIIFGEIKLVKWFPWIQYDPVEYKITGNEIRHIESIIKPGDVIFRRYNGYIDNWFIQGKYSHAGLYIGNDEIIHAVNPHVQKIQLIDFCRCDEICIMRPSEGILQALAIADKYLQNKIPYDFSFTDDDSQLYCFELCARCYPDLDIPKYEVSQLAGLLKRNAYLSTSFIDSHDFIKIYEV